MGEQRFASVWDAIEDTPQQAASMRVRSELMLALQKWLKNEGLPQVTAAGLLGVTQPRVSDLVWERINLFSLDTLIDMAATAGLSPSVTIKKPKAGQRAAHQDVLAP